MRKAANLPVGRRPDEDMWNKLWDRMVLVLAVCLASLLIFSAASLEWSIYLAVLCLAVWICILLYRHKENCTFFVQVLLVGLGNLAAFLLQRFLAGNALLPSSLNRREIVPAALLCLGVVYILFGLLHSMTANQSASAKTPPQLFPEREYDLQRLDAFLKHGAPLIGIDAPWGDGKTFLVDYLCQQSRITSQYEIVRINALAGNEDEIELTLMQEFDRILRRGRIFSQASKQMLKLLESNDLLKQLRWLLVQDTQSVSSTFSDLLGDLEKLEKDILILVDDIERLGDQTLIRKLFALMESVSSRNVQIIYMFNSAMLKDFDRNYLEKYIPCYMSLTPIHFSSIVTQFWDELKLNETGLDRNRAMQIADMPQTSGSIWKILGLNDSFPQSFHLDNITVRRTRTFLEEFPDLEKMVVRPEWMASDQFGIQLLFQGLFIKHFLHREIFETLELGIPLPEAPLFSLDKKMKDQLEEAELPAPERMTFLDLLDLRFRLADGKKMRAFVEKLLADQTNYNCLTALAMLGYDYTDVWRQIQEQEQPEGRRSSANPTAPSPNRRDTLLARAEQIANEERSVLVRERNNEWIDRVMWNLLANGSSECPNPDSYVRHFVDVVLTKSQEAQLEAWHEFSKHAYRGNIYKNNKTGQRWGMDPYLPLFQGFCVTGASSETWQKFLNFYFGVQMEENSAISVEMIQNLNYVDMQNRNVYLAVLNGFLSRKIVGNLNSEPCMYRFLKKTLLLVYSLGYTRGRLFHDVWYEIPEPQMEESMLPSQAWEAAVQALEKRFDVLKDSLKKSKLADSRLEWFNQDIDVILRFLDQCRKLIRQENTITMSMPHLKVEQFTRSRHQETCDKLRMDLRAGMNPGQWFHQLQTMYEAGRLDPGEVRDLVDSSRKDSEGHA